MRRLTNKIIACILILILVFSFLPASGFAGTSDSLDLSFISNKKNREYISTMIDYHFQEDSSLLTTLKNGNAVIFMFEGGSDYVTGENSDYDKYKNQLTKYRVGAVCIVLKYNTSTKKPYVAFTNEACSTLPGFPLSYGAYSNGKGSEYGTATIKDGKYSIYTVSHRGYAGYNVRDSKSDASISALYMKSNGSYDVMNASGINIHSRTSYGLGSASSPWSAGCLLVSGKSNPTDYNNFIAKSKRSDSAVETVTWKYNSNKIYKFKTSGTYTGKLIVDRYLYRDVMKKSIYKNSSAVDAITKNSVDNYNLAAKVKVSGVSISADSLEMIPGENCILRATITPANASNQSVTWKTDNSDVAVVGKNGTVTGVGAGTAKITVTTADGGFTDSCTVTVWVPHKHEWNSDYTVDVPAGCTTDGSKSIHCKTCSSTKDAATIPKKGHTEVTDNAVAATCTAAGKTAGKHCSVCGTVTVAQTTIPANGHKEVTDNAVAATCTAAGKTAGKHCSVCGTVTVAQTTVSAKGHSFSNGICTVCGTADPNYKPQITGTKRIYGSNRYETAFKAADELKALRGGKQFDNVIVACGTNFADALAGSYLAAVKDAPILLVQPSMVNKVTNYIKTNLRAGGTVYILGGTNAVPASMEAGLGGFTVKRFAGANRYETNLMILNEAGVGDKEILVATGTNFADSLSASATGKPILLVGAKLTSAQKQFLAGTKGTKYILGGTNAVSSNIENELKAYGAVKRLGGANRYATSVLIAETFFSSPKSAVLSYAQNFPDGLCGGVIAYKQGAPMLLVTDSGAKAADTYAAKCGIKNGYVLGGTGLISDATMKAIFS